MVEQREERSKRILSCAEGAEVVIRARAGGVVVLVEGDAEVSVRAGRADENEPALLPWRPRDVRVEKALAALRAEPERRWTVRALATIASFALLARKVIGESSPTLR